MVTIPDHLRENLHGFQAEYGAAFRGRLPDPALPLCPECRGGKCQNCTEQVLDAEDAWQPCGCTNTLHKEPR